MAQLPRWMIWSGLAILLVSWIPFALVGKARATKSARPPVHFVPDMDDQPRYDTQEENRLFADTRAMRPTVEGTVARGSAPPDDPAATGRLGENWVTWIPVEPGADLLERGRDRYDVYCSHCHGLDGSGQGIVNQRALDLEEGTWTPPTDLRTDLIRERPVGHLFNTITHGIRNMPGHGRQLPEEDRWAIVAYLRALQLAQGAPLEAVPDEEREALR